MPEVLTQVTSAPPDCAIKTRETSDTTITRPVPQGLRAWLPALVVVLGMPLLALVTTKYGLLPSMKRAFTQSAAVAAQSAAGQDPDAFFFAKIPLTAPGVHTGFRSIGLLGANTAFKSKIDRNKAKLMNLAASELKDTTVSDLDKPGALEAKRAQLLADFNLALGGSVVRELYIAEWPSK